MWSGLTQLTHFQAEKEHAYKSDDAGRSLGPRAPLAMIISLSEHTSSVRHYSTHESIYPGLKYRASKEPVNEGWGKRKRENILFGKWAEMRLAAPLVIVLRAFNDSRVLVLFFPNGISFTEYYPSAYSRRSQ